MAANTQKVKPVGTRRGHPIYEHNPSVTSHIPSLHLRERVTRKGTERLLMVAHDGSGEIFGQGSFSFVEEKIVDTENFIKIFAAGVKGHGELSKAGKEIFSVVFQEMSGRQGQDKETVGLNYRVAQKRNPELSERTFFRGMSELLDKEFLYRSALADTYFVNIGFMFNVNRINVMTSYIRKGSPETLDASQQSAQLTLVK